MFSNDNGANASRTTSPGFGALVISLDFEAHWGVRDKHPSDGRYRQNLLGERQAIPQILRLFEEFDVAATWATVGFLFASSRKELENFYPKTRPAYTNPVLSPYHEPIGNGEEDDPLHFAPSLIQTIRKHPRQEIGSHTFSHYYCLEPGHNRDSFKADLESAIAIAQKDGITIRSFVFPRNQFNTDYIDTLADAGITSYRGNQNGWMYRAVPANEQKLYMRGSRLMDQYTNISGLNLGNWTNVGGEEILNIPASYFLRPYTPKLRRFDTLRLRRVSGILEVAARFHKIVHLWWHPHNFGVFTDENIAFLRKILTVFAATRERSDMRSLTMEEVAVIAGEMQYGF